MSQAILKDEPKVHKLSSGGYQITCSGQNNSSIVFVLHHDTVYLDGVQGEWAAKDIAFAVGKGDIKTEQTIKKLFFGSVSDTYYKQSSASAPSPPRILAVQHQVALGNTRVPLLDPEYYGCSKPKCPRCGSDKVVSNGWSQQCKQLVGHEGDVYALCKRYKCQGEADHIGKCFQAWDPEVLQGLPCEVRRGLMGIPTQKGGLTFSFIEHAMAMVAQGSSISSVLSARNEVARRDYHVKEVEYLSYIAQHWASGIGPGSDGSGGRGRTAAAGAGRGAAVVQQEDAVGGEGTERRGGRRRARENELAPSVRQVRRRTTAAGDNEMAEAYNGKDVSQSYFTGLLIECASLLVDAHDQYQRSLTFKILRIDAGYKNAKKVRCADGSRAMEGTVAILNEINQVVAIFHGSGGLKELEEPLRRLKQRNEELGGGPVELIYVDNCRTVAGFLERLFVGAKVKEDLFHVLQRMRDTLPHGHPLADPFMKEYTAACKVRDPSDEKKAREGYNTSPELAVHIMSLFLGRWNRDQSFKHGDADYGMYDYDLLQRVNDLARRLGHAVRYPEADVKLASVEEKMHFEWKHLQPGYGSISGGSRWRAAVQRALVPTRRSRRLRNGSTTAFTAGRAEDSATADYWWRL
ncbi:hypothetical protein PLESTM_001417600 [Pleodorina starrii]|nr:hypothetical protein PLESTM_001417600 [Pleodorina starrii]